MEIYYRYSVSVFSCSAFWPEGLFRLSDFGKPGAFFSNVQTNCIVKYGA